MQFSKSEKIRCDSEIQHIDFYVSCKDLKSINPQPCNDTYVLVQEKRGTQWCELQKTYGTLNCFNSNFPNPIRSLYIFEKKQPLKFSVYMNYCDGSLTFIGSLETTVAEIASRRQQNLIGKIKNKEIDRGIIIIRGEYVKNFTDEISLNLSAHDVIDQHFWFWQKPCPFLRFFKRKIEDGQPLLIFETQQILNLKQATWNDIVCKSQQLCCSDYSMPITVQLMDKQKNQIPVLLGSTTFTVNELLDSQTNPRKLTKEFLDVKQKFVGILSFDDFKLHQKILFEDYLNDGLELNLLIGIDFTHSNKPSDWQDSLHFFQNSDYLRAIKSVGEVLIYYDKDKKVSMYGFGCIPQMENINSDKVSHCFNLNDNPDDPEVTGLDGIEKCYRQALPQLLFWAPTLFCPIIQNAMKIAQKCKNEGSKCYQILLILTDGQIEDHEETFELIVKSSELPISFIIIGLGDQDFSYMKDIDNNDLQKVTNNGEKAKRDSACFVPFNSIKNDPSSLSKEVLKELPDQVVQYMQLMNIMPKLKGLIKN